MNRFAASLFLLISMSITACAQAQAPTLLHEAAHCLATDDHHWLDPQLLKAPELLMGFHPDTKTTLGDKYLYVVVYTGPHRNEGKIFDIRVKSHHVYVVENAATFVSSAKGVDFPVPPVGGTWAQTQFATTVQQIEHHKLYSAPVKYLLKPSSHIQCETSMETK